MSVSAVPAPTTPVTTTLAVAARGHGPFGSPAMHGWEGCVVGVSGASWLLGVRAPDRGRSILAVTVDGELAVALRDVVPGGIAVIRDARFDDADDICAACLPWPWMVVGSVASLPPGIAAVLRHRPVLTYWLGVPPSGLPGHARWFQRPGALFQAVRGACSADVGGMRLAPGSGVELDDGTLMRGANLESLVSAYPYGFALPVRGFRAASDALARHNPGWVARRDGAARTTLVRADIGAQR